MSSEQSTLGGGDGMRKGMGCSGAGLGAAAGGGGGIPPALAPPPPPPRPQLISSAVTDVVGLSFFAKLDMAIVLHLHVTCTIEYNIDLHCTGWIHSLCTNRPQCSPNYTFTVEYRVNYTVGEYECSISQWRRRASALTSRRRCDIVIATVIAPALSSCRRQQRLVAPRTATRLIQTIILVPS